jgi:hypothetical protein
LYHSFVSRIYTHAHARRNVRFAWG